MFTSFFIHILKFFYSTESRMVGTVAAVGAVVATGGTVAPLLAAAASQGTAATVATSAIAASGAATGTMAGAAVAGGSAMAATGSATAGLYTAAIVAGPVGWLLLGTSLDGKTESGITYDCWKPVLHDSSPEPSQGKFLKEVMEDPRIKQIIVEDEQSQLPKISLVNIWDEKFDIQYLLLPSINQLVAHAIQIQ